MAKYQLIFKKGEEVIKTGNTPESKTYKGTLAITSAILESFFPILNKPETNPVEVAHCIELLSYLLDTPIGIDDLIAFDKIKNIKFYKGELVWNTVRAIHHVVNKWLVTGDTVTPPPPLSIDECLSTLTSGGDVDGLETFAVFFMQAGINESPPVPFFSSQDILKTVNSNFLFNLVWNEIWHTLEKDVKYLKSCPFCGTIYYAPKNNPHKSHCGSPTCSKKYLIESHGGIYGYREWERIRKIRTKSDRKPGRPKKQKAGE
ncbi:MAG: hypothetical protein ABFD50_05210 [Smithella sp.]